MLVGAETQAWCSHAPALQNERKKQTKKNPEA